MSSLFSCRPGWYCESLGDMHASKESKGDSVPEPGVGPYIGPIPGGTGQKNFHPNGVVFLEAGIR